MKLNLLRESADVGTEVTLRLTRGSDSSGRLVEMTSTYVVLDDGVRRSTIFEDLLAGWEISKPAAESREDSSDHPVEQPVYPEPQVEVPTAAGLRQSPQIGASELVARVEAEFSSMVKLSFLTLPEPSFELTDSEVSAEENRDIVRELIRAKNQYEYAIKVRELSRLSEVIARVVRPLCRKYPAAPNLEYLIGCIELKLGSKQAALLSFIRAAELSRDPGHWSAVAAVALSEHEMSRAKDALDNFFALSTPDRSRNEWFVYLKLLLQVQEYSVLWSLASGYRHIDSRSDEFIFIAESLMFILTCLGKRDESFAVADIIISEGNSGVQPSSSTGAHGAKPLSRRCSEFSGGVLFGFAAGCGR